MYQGRASENLLESLSALGQIEVRYGWIGSVRSQTTEGEAKRFISERKKTDLLTHRYDLALEKSLAAR